MTEAVKIKIDACTLFLGKCCLSCHKDYYEGYDLCQTFIGNLEIRACCYVTKEVEKKTESEILALWKATNDE